MAKVAKKEFIPEEVLHEHDLKSTPLRIALLSYLAEHRKPVSIAMIAKKVKKLKADLASIYRALHAFTEKGIVQELQLSRECRSYELVEDRGHKHHIVCKKCNIIEPIDFCVRGIEQNVKEKSRLFNRISEHNLSFIGTCRKCVRAVR